MQVTAKRRALLGLMSDMDLRLLRVFKAVVECGGMASAERELNIGISTISRHIKDLETRLGLTLCRRGRAGFALTAEGHGIYEQTLRLLASVEAFRSSLDDLHGRLGGELNVAVVDKTATNPRARLGEAIARFSEAAPAVVLNLHVASLVAVEQGVIDGRFHVGIAPVYRPARGFISSALFDETMLLYCGASHPLFDAPQEGLTWRQMRNYRFAGLGYNSPNMELAHREKLSRKATGFDQESIATLILSGAYLGFLPDHYAASFEGRGLMRSVAPKRFRYACRFTSMLRRSPEPARAALLFQECLTHAHRSP